MSIINLKIKINNKSDFPVRVTENYPVINWEFESANRVEIDEYTGDITNISTVEQYSYEIRISTFNGNLGTDEFIGNRVSTREVINEDHFWVYRGVPLDRGTKYYGQLKVVDTIGRESDWETFTFDYNSLCYVNNLKITPSLPTVEDNLILSYDFYDDDGDTEGETLIRWFKNGINQKQLDNFKVVSSEQLTEDDIWSVDILPSDGYEYGPRKTSSLIKIVKSSYELSDIEILPKQPTVNDILSIGFTANNINASKNLTIRWFINGKIQKEYNNERYIRPDVEVGDEIRCEIKTDGGTSFVSTNSVYIQDSEFIVYDLEIDGQPEPLEVSTLEPVVKWKVHNADGKDYNYISIKIGTFYEADNVYSQVMNSQESSFAIPYTTIKNIEGQNTSVKTLNKGMDYYVSIAVSETNSFSKYTTTHFKFKGSRWEESVSNSTGWTIETIFILKNEINFDEFYYHTLRIQDGSRFGEVRIYSNKIGFISDSEIVFSEEFDASVSQTLTVVGKNDNIKIYLNRKIAIDGTGLFKQSSSNKILELGNFLDNILEINYKYFNYTVSGDFYPGIDTEYNEIQLHDYLFFKDNDIVSLKGYKKSYNGETEDNKIFAVNPYDTNKNSSLYALLSNKSYKHSTVNKTIAPINKIRMSPDGKTLAVAHSQGVSIIKGYFISSFDYEIDFVTISANGVSSLLENYPDNYNWELVQNVGFEAAYFDNNGFHINTINEDREN